MNLAPDEEQTALAQRLRSLGATALGADIETRDRTQRLQPGDWQRCAEAGVLGLPCRTSTEDLVWTR